MFKNVLNGIYLGLAKEDREEFEKFAAFENIKRAKYVYIICFLCVSFYIYAAFRLYHFYGIYSDTNYFYFAVMAFIFIFLSASLQLTYLVNKNKETYYNAINKYAGFSVFIILHWGACVSLFSDMGQIQVGGYIATMFLASSAFYSNLATAIISYLSSFVLFIMGLYNFDFNLYNFDLIIQSTGICIFISLIVLILNYKRKINEFKNIRVIEKSNSSIDNLKKELQHISNADYLTKIPNKLKTDKTLEAEWSRAIRNESQIAFAILDIDYFSKYNEFYGFSAGDECLKKIGGLIKECIKRSYESVGRYNGDRFVVILPGSGYSDAYKICEKLRESVIEADITHSKAPGLKIITVSIGVALTSPREGSSLERFIECAENSVRTAKESGRNRIELGII